MLRCTRQHRLFATSPTPTLLLFIPPYPTEPWLSLLKNSDLTLPNMSGSDFLSSEAEAALLGQEEEARQLFYQQQMANANRGHQVNSSSYQQQWPPSPGISLANTQLSPSGYAGPSQYPSWPTASWSGLGPNEYVPGQYPSSSYTPTVPSSPYASNTQYNSNAPWPALHPDDREAASDISRSASPDPADLHNFGFLLPDGRSWRCAYPQCTSSARFTRGCDLRKHYKRHTKHLLCRYEDCPQSKEGGFSSKKDRDRHESRHNPGVSCTHKGCERVFSRVDNMKDHVRRIHRKHS
ncbi:hypothetical protein N7G274_000371 [Stereocaulon virgatum]|uniref:C2H2-type domain-containing protein n=1 Tax=Stereocaulon virgatum TaxID=373712 RepID=A0ABR4ASF5_9LECA